MSDDYQPIACGFYDELGIRMMRGQTCTLLLNFGEGATKEITAVITDIFTEGDEEFAQLDGTTRVRLDRIARVDHVDRPGACG
jgi:transcriptional antiterminator Rof (Rho-off)